MPSTPGGRCWFLIFELWDAMVDGYEIGHRTAERVMATLGE